MMHRVSHRIERYQDATENRLQGKTDKFNIITSNRLLVPIFYELGRALAVLQRPGEYVKANYQHGYREGIQGVNKPAPTSHKPKNKKTKNERDTNRATVVNVHIHNKKKRSGEKKNQDYTYTNYFERNNGFF